VSEQEWVGASEQLLPAQAIEGDKNKIGSYSWLGIRLRRLREAFTGHNKRRH
jgi:hypothetical protein